MATKDEALSLAAAGWQILPLRGKIPVTRHGVKDASSQLKHVAQWWAGQATHNVGARVPGHLVVLDLDPRNGGTLEVLETLNGGKLSPTLTVHSGRGDGGRHLYYRHPGGKLSARRLPDGIDVKTDTGYCVVPPSLHPETGQPYVWGEHPTPEPLPFELLTLLRVEPPRQAQSFAVGSLEGLDLLRIRAQHLAIHMASAAEGNRNGRLFWATCQAIRDGHPRETFDLLAAAAIAAGLSADEAWETIKSAQRTERGVS